jgi:hypothetical protein
MEERSGGHKVFTSKEHAMRYRRCFWPEYGMKL